MLGGKQVLLVADGLDHPVSLHQIDEDRFSVQYGKDMHIDLTWGQAADILGRCIMHSLQCTGNLE